jgi:hypothetical protein
MGKTISAKLIALAVLVSSSFAAKGTFFSSYRRPAEGTLTSWLSGNCTPLLSTMTPFFTWPLVTIEDIHLDKTQKHFINLVRQVVLRKAYTNL